MYAFAPEKPPGLAGRNFCLAIFRIIVNARTIASSDFSAKFDFPGQAAMRNRAPALRSIRRS
jgi:hypothetical protein